MPCYHYLLLLVSPFIFVTVFAHFNLGLCPHSFKKCNFSIQSQPTVWVEPEYCTNRAAQLADSLPLPLLQTLPDRDSPSSADEGSSCLMFTAIWPPRETPTDTTERLTTEQSLAPFTRFPWKSEPQDSVAENYFQRKSAPPSSAMHRHGHGVNNGLLLQCRARSEGQEKKCWIILRCSRFSHVCPWT